MIDNKIIMVCGDSTGFVGWDEGDTIPNPNLSWPSLLQQNNACTVRNMCVGGARITKTSGLASGSIPVGIWSLEDSQMFACGWGGMRAVVYLAGVNDFLNPPAGGAARTADCLRGLIIDGIENGLYYIENSAPVPTKVLVCSPLRGYRGVDEFNNPLPIPTNSQGEYLTDYCTALNNIVTSIQAIGYPDFEIDYLDMQNVIPNEQSNYLADGYHIRAFANELVEEAISARLITMGVL